MKIVLNNAAVRQREVFGAFGPPFAARTKQPKSVIASLSHCSILLSALALLRPGTADAQIWPPLQAVPPATVPAAQLGNAGETLVATQVVANGATIPFTGLAGNVKYRLSCHGLQLATNGNHFLLQIGEGATPTWETGGNYWFANFTVNSASNATSATSSQSAAAINLDFNTSALVIGANGNYNAAYEFDFGDLAATGYKPFVFTGSWWSTTPSLQPEWGSGAWHGDTNAITAVQLVGSSGNITGTCNLYQRNGS